MYEPMIVLRGTQPRKTSRAAERVSTTGVAEFPAGDCHHRGCYAQAYSQEFVHETGR